MNDDDHDSCDMRRAEPAAAIAATCAKGLMLATAILICAGLASCGRDVTAVPAAPALPFSTAAPTPPGGGDTSVPDAARTFDAQNIAERAKVAAMGASAAAAAPTVATLANSRAPNTMSKEQESKSMPLPGQVNDHSTPARDKKLVK